MKPISHTRGLRLRRSWIFCNKLPELTLQPSVLGNLSHFQLPSSCLGGKPKKPFQSCPVDAALSSTPPSLLFLHPFLSNFLSSLLSCLLCFLFSLLSLFVSPSLHPSLSLSVSLSLPQSLLHTHTLSLSVLITHLPFVWPNATHWEQAYHLHTVSVLRELSAR